MPFYCICTCWAPGGSQNGPMKKGPSLCPTVCLGLFLELDRYFFLKFGMVVETLIKLRVTEPDFLEKTVFATEIGVMGQK